MTTAVIIALAVLLAAAVGALAVLYRRQQATANQPTANPWPVTTTTPNKGVLHAIAFMPDALRVHLTGKDEPTVAALTKGTPTDDGNGMVYTIDEGVTLTVKPFDRTVELKSDHASITCTASYNNDGFTVDDTDRLLGFFTRVKRNGKDVAINPADALNRKFTPQTSTVSVPLDTI